MEASKLGSRDLVGQQTVDYEPRVDIARLRRERLARLQTEIRTAGLGALLLFDPVNIRYATGARFPGVFYLRFHARYALVPQDGPVLLFAGPEDSVYADTLLEVAQSIWWDYFPCGRHVNDVVTRWATDLQARLRTLGLVGERLGIDRLDFLGLQALTATGLVIADGRIPVERARAVKTQDELVLVRQACAIADVAICAVRDALCPGVTENELFAILAATNLRFGGEHMDVRLLTAGDNTKAFCRYSTDRLIRPGDLIALDTDMAGPMNYMADLSRTYLCGDVRPTASQREAYRVAYDFIAKSLSLFRPGAGFDAIASNVPPFPRDYLAGRYGWIAHGVGMSDEWPSIYFPDRSRSGFGNDPDVLQENMVICVEALATKEGTRESVKLEEQVIITRDGPEVISRAPHDWRLLE